MQFRTMKVRKDPRCPACGTREIKALIDYEQFCGIPQAAAAEKAAAPMAEITPRELAEKLRRKDDFDLIDVREKHEWEIARIPGARLIPLSTFAQGLPQLDRNRDIVVHCKSGGRSAKAVKALQEAGYSRVWNVTGGILRWSDEVDPSVPKY
jgi:adenylyltransferase/sulfurtransferase